jgi:hypothetical protein
MLKISNDLLKEIKSQNQVWIKIEDKDWEFLFEELTGKDILKMSAGGVAKEEFLSAIIVNGIKDWKNVKLSDVADIQEGSKFFDNRDKDIQFSQDVFDIFLGRHPEYIEQIAKGIESFKLKEKTTLDDRKKKLENT